MKKIVLSITSLILLCVASMAQPKPVPTSSPQPTTRAPLSQRQPASFDLTAYGVSFAVEPRLIIMMAALEAAGFEATPSVAGTSIFRAQVRKDLATLDPDL